MALLMLVLAFIGGYADAGSFMLVASFTGHVTGNAVLTMISLATGAWSQAALCGLAVGGFAAGTAAGSVRRGEDGRPEDGARHGARTLVVALTAEITLAALALTAFVTVRTGGQTLFIACFSLALGVQNGALRTVRGAGVHTTYVTGMSTSLIGSLVSGGARGPTGARLLLAGPIAGFVAGALTGAVLTGQLGIAGFGGILVPMSAALAVAGSAGPLDPGRSAAG